MTGAEVFRDVVGRLDAAGIAYMLTGSFASAYHGLPRATQDIDFVIAPTRDQLHAFLVRLPATECYADESAALEALAGESQFNLIDLRSGWKVDLICRRSRPFSRTEFDRRRRHRRPTIAATLALAFISSACGGAEGDGPQGGISLETRIEAATATAQSSTNACAPIQPFYWEVGDRTARLASGSVPANNGNPAYTGTTLMSIASASKWLYGAYVVQERQGQLSDSDLTFLTFRSGYTHFTRCLSGQTVDECVAYGNNGVHSDATDGLFAYGGGHMEKHASLSGLGSMDGTGLANAMRSQLGNELTPLAYSQPQLAGGVVTDAETYAVFLRKIVSGGLRMHAALGTHAVCTNPATCPQAVNAPVPATESYHYSIGHWVEDDPVNGDSAFSSAGAFGFYPWIDAGKTWYGIIARRDTSGTSDPGNPDAGGHGFASALCGQLIRGAWIQGVPR